MMTCSIDLYSCDVHKVENIEQSRKYTVTAWGERRGIQTEMTGRRYGQIKRDRNGETKRRRVEIMKDGKTEETERRRDGEKV